jgi:hypothetical protein
VFAAFGGAAIACGPKENPNMTASVLRDLVRNFPENGPKLLLENPANVRDFLVLLREPAVPDIDFAAMTVERSHFVQPDHWHVALHVMLKAPFRKHLGPIQDSSPSAAIIASHQVA